MSQIIEGLKNEVGLVRFSVLSDTKIQLEYKIPIISQNVIIDEIKMKFRYKKQGDIWSFISLRERFINQLSVRYGIKKKNIKSKYLEKDKNNNPFNYTHTKVLSAILNLNVDGVNYTIRGLMISFIFDDIVWHRERLLKSLINN